MSWTIGIDLAQLRWARMRISGVDYLIVFVVTASITLGLTPIALRYAVRREIFDRPGIIKSQESPVPYLGGLAIVVSFAAVILVAATIRRPDGGYLDLVTLLGLAVLLAFVGLVDDLRGLSPFLRLAVEVAAGVLVWQSQGAAFLGNDVLDLLVTVLWVVGVTNAMNLLDNMDGLSAGVAAIASFWFFVIAAANGQFLVATLAIALCGCSIGFLRSNFHPARIYMGDAGALFIGFLLAAIGLRLRFEGPTEVTFFVPILVLGVPLFDTTLVTVNRLLHRRSPLSGGRDHSSHRIVFVGVPVRAAVGLIYAGAVSLGWLGVVMANVDRDTGFLLMAWVLAAAAFVGTMLSVIPVYETSRRRHLMLQEVRRHEQPIGPDRADPAGEPPESAQSA